ncbi:ABC transporter substrate-binding protein [Azospirillum halopraeferens]|uniref:ABC transporter substrate-binding protein n=1 Tax=Azospirillum halopraeferens TaxID=34010 RepID=UPI000401F55C|nr:ABC transporter substrate-binding protein [Azospirillum halopraeferens]
MIRALSALVLLLAAVTVAATPPAAAVTVVYPPPAAPTGPRTLEIHGATDIEAMDPVIRSFQELHPDIAVTYEDLNTNELYERFLADEAAGRPGPDLVLSSAMDLQIKLVNDGYAQPYASPEAAALPRWATWRNEAFGFTSEPVVIVYNRERLHESEVPQSRWDLAELLRTQPERFRGKVATYDVRASGVGYLFVTQDSKQSPAIWDLAREFGAVDVHLHDRSATILDAVAQGDLLIGYNLLGAYARARADRDDRIGIVMPEDYTLVMSRTAFIPRRAGNPGPARLFLDHLLSERGQRIIAGPSHLYAIHPDVHGPTTLRAVEAAAPGPLRPIRMGPGLLVYLDASKRRLFLRQFLGTIERP